MTPLMVTVKWVPWLFAPNSEHIARETETSLRIQQTRTNGVMTRWRLMDVIGEVM